MFCAPPELDLDLEQLLAGSLSCFGYPKPGCSDEPVNLVTGGHFCGAWIRRVLCGVCTTRLRVDWENRRETGRLLTCPYCQIPASVLDFNLKITAL